MKHLEYYAEAFGKLNREKKRAKWPAEFYHQSPHKPLLLLSVVDLFAEGLVKSNLIEITPDLGELFTLYWSRVMPLDQRSTMALPFFHLRKDGFWHLVPQPGKEAFVESVSQIRSIIQLRDCVIGARLDDELYRLLCTDKARSVLRCAILDGNFAPELHPKLLEQALINIKAYEYSKELLEEARKGRPKKVKEEAGLYQQAVRDQAFRRAVVTAYSHRCAFCGIRMLTHDGHTAVDAAHIIPWSETYDDNPKNGMALCKLCHWSFDEGMLGVSNEYVVLASPQLTSTPDVWTHFNAAS
ncbi:MAG: HNH endonuclease [Acidobacteriota bacterium]